MKIANVQPNTQAWLDLRKNYDTASEAPAALGVSKFTSRTDLMHQKATGTTEAVSHAKQAVFDRGHAAEEMARPLGEDIIGESLYPITGTLEVDGLNLLASLDGATMDEEIIWETKLWSESLAADVRNQTLALHYTVQMDQQLLVSGAKKCLFMTSDGTKEKTAWCWYETTPEKQAALIAGWHQFRKDLAAYVPPEVIVPAVAAPQIGLPAVSIQVTGSIALVDNLEKFGTALTAYIASLNRKPETDQDFANLEDAVKRLKNAEDQLDAAESSAIGQAESIDAMRRTVALHRDTARSTRLLIDKLVKAEKENRRTKIVSDAVAELHSHITALNGRARNNMPPIANQFNEVIKGLKSIDSMRDKVAGELARCKIESNAIADRIQYHLELLDDEVEFGFLFPDHHQIVLKASDDFKALVSSRIAAHKVAEAAKQAAIIARIEAEAKEKAEREAREKVAAEQAEAAAKLAAETAAEQNPVSATAQTVVMHGNLPTTLEQFNKTYPPLVKKAVVATPTLSLGEISTRLGFNCTSVFLASLGFDATTVKAAKLYQSDDFPDICRAIIEHIESVCELQVA